MHQGNHNEPHYATKKMCEALINQKQSIITVLSK